MTFTITQLNRDMKTPKKIAKGILFALISCIFSILIYGNYKSFTVTRYYKDCGIVVSKSTSEVIIKRGTNTELYLNVNFKKSGFQSINVTPTTYFKHKVNDNVCFDLEHEDYNELYDISVIFSFIILSAIILGYVLYAIDDDNDII